MTTPIEAIAAKAADRLLWSAYSDAKSTATKAGACRECSQRIAMAKVRASAGDEETPPKLCGNCRRLFPATARAA